MNTSFCTSCGAKHSYAYAPPKFCSNCGDSIGGSHSPKKHIATAKRLRGRQDDEELEEAEDSSDIDYVPDIAEIALHVEHDELMSHSLGSILQQTNDSPRRFAKRSFDLDQLKSSRGPKSS